MNNIFCRTSRVCSVPQNIESDSAISVGSSVTTNISGTAAEIKENSNKVSSNSSLPVKTNTRIPTKPNSTSPVQTKKPHVSPYKYSGDKKVQMGRSPLKSSSNVVVKENVATNVSRNDHSSPVKKYHHSVSSSGGKLRSPAKLNISSSSINSKSPVRSPREIENIPVKLKAPISDRYVSPSKRRERTVSGSSIKSCAEKDTIVIKGDLQKDCAQDLIACFTGMEKSEINGIFGYQNECFMIFLFFGMQEN